MILRNEKLYAETLKKLIKDFKKEE